MRYLIILFLLPIITLAQQGTENWITPFAHIEFHQGKIVYYYLQSDAPVIRLRPQFYVKDSFQMIPASGIYNGDKTSTEIKTELRSSVECAEPVGIVKAGKQDFLQQVALLVVWMTCGQEPVSKNTMDKVGTLACDSDTQVAAQAKLVNLRCLKYIPIHPQVM